MRCLAQTCATLLHLALLQRTYFTHGIQFGKLDCTNFDLIRMTADTSDNCFATLYTAIKNFSTRVS